RHTRFSRDWSSDVCSSDLLDAEVTRFARAVVASGLRPGDRAAIWAPNSARWIIAALGVLAAGGILVPVNTRFKGEEARYAIGREIGRACVGRCWSARGCSL